MPRTYRRKTAPVSPEAIERAMLDVATKRLSLSRAAKMHSVSRSTLGRRRRNGEHKFHKNKIFSPSLESNLCLRLLAFSLTKSGLSDLDLRRKSYEIGCSFLKRGVIDKLPASWHHRKLAGYEWWLNFKKNLEFDVKKSQWKDSGASIELCRVCEKIHEKGAENFLNVASFAGKFEWACESCFLERWLVH